MIAKLIRWSVGNRVLVMLATLFLVAWGVFSLRSLPIDALPPVGRASDHPYLLPRSGATDRRKPGHLPADNHHALGTGGQDCARLLGLR